MSRTVWAVMLAFNTVMLAVTLFHALEHAHSLWILATIPWTAAATICLISLTKPNP